LESRHAIYPRIILGRDAEAAVARPNTRLLCDADGWTFINYLEPLSISFPKPLRRGSRPTR
jgi:hypothetical protein